ncbi:MAG TPA: glycosyltransferase family 4 protein [Edaphobacter sp.]|nr:glycosyltransferase family 4 protein [Edaphobacter sp.]
MKPLVLLLVNTGFWSVGEIGRQIIRRFRHKYDFLFLPESVVGRRPDMLNEVLQRADLVCCLNESGVPLLLRFARKPLPPVITWIHHVTSWSEEHESAAKNSDLIVAVTPSWKDRIASFAPGCRVESVRVGVDLDFFNSRSISRRELGLPETGFIVGFFGARGSDHDGGRKGMDVLLSVLRQVGKEISQVHAVFVGPGWEEFASEFRAAGSGATVFGFVPRSRIPGLYSALDAYLVTARVEGGPMTVLESLACGTPVISTRVGLVGDVIVEGVNGFTAEIGDVNTLANSVIRMASDPQLKSSMKAASRDSVTEWSWTDKLSAFEPLMDELIRRPLKQEGMPSLRWVQDVEDTQRVCYAAECLAVTITDVRRGRTPLMLNLRILRSMLEGSRLIDCTRALALLRGFGYGGQ